MLSKRPMGGAPLCSFEYCQYMDNDVREHALFTLHLVVINREEVGLCQKIPTEVGVPNEALWP